MNDTNNTSNQTENKNTDNSTLGTVAQMAGKHVGKAVGLAAAAVASAIVVRAFRKFTDSDVGEEPIFHLKQHDDSWALLLEGEKEPKATFETKEEGLKAARELAQRSLPCELVVYRMDGTIQDRHSYAS